MSDDAKLSAEEWARRIMGRIGVPNAEEYSNGDVVELANLLDELRGLRGSALPATPENAWFAGPDAIADIAVGDQWFTIIPCPQCGSVKLTFRGRQLGDGTYLLRCLCPNVHVFDLTPNPRPAPAAS